MSRGTAGGPPAWKVLVATTLANTIALLPPFLLGALSVFVRRDIVFSETQLGFAVAVYFLASAAFSMPGGRLSERLGARASVLIAASTSTATLVGIGLLVRSWATLLVFLAIGGLANGIAQPAANLALSRGIPLRRQGIAFGVKQSAILFATLASGLAVSLVAIPFGWNSAFLVIGPVLFLALLVVYPPTLRRDTESPRAGSRPAIDLRGRGLGLLAVASACVTATAGTLGVFLVESGVDAGLSAGTAGFVLSLGSGAGVTTRLVVGWVADRGVRQPLNAVAAMLFVGVVGFACLALGAPETHVIGTVIAFAAGWGWAGLFVYAVVRAFPHAPAAATGVTQTGFSAGNVFGPVVFGWVVSISSYGAAWGAMAVLAAVGTVLMWRGAVVVRRTGPDAG